MSARLPIRMCVLGLLIVFPNLLPAQQQPAPLIYASYYKCDPAPGGRLEAIVSDKIAPPLDRALSAGRISGWGWLRHHTGGSWDRAGYLLAPNLDALLDAVEELRQEMAEGLQELGAICRDHEDYIWEYVSGSRPAADLVRERPPAGYSRYWECELGRETRADSLVTQVFAPLFERQISDGRLNSWAWWRHHTGGKYRRLAVTDGADHKTVVAAQVTIVESLQKQHPDALREFGEICTSHQDYLWNIRAPTAATAR